MKLDTYVLMPFFTESRARPIVLIVDAVDSNRHFLSATLTKAGFTVTEADSGVQSLQKLEPRPDVIVLDSHLPDISGIEICRQLKNSHLKDIPVIQTSTAKLTGIHSDADAYLTNPLDPEVLLNCVNTCLKK